MLSARVIAVVIIGAVVVVTVTARMTRRNDELGSVAIRHDRR
jgi:hypothetical protein